MSVNLLCDQDLRNDEKTAKAVMREHDVLLGILEMYRDEIRNERFPADKAPRVNWEPDVWDDNVDRLRAEILRSKEVQIIVALRNPLRVDQIVTQLLDLGWSKEAIEAYMPHPRINPPCTHCGKAQLECWGYGLNEGDSAPIKCQHCGEMLVLHYRCEHYYTCTSRSDLNA